MSARLSAAEITEPPVVDSTHWDFHWFSPTALGGACVASSAGLDSTDARAGRVAPRHRRLRVLVAVLLDVVLEAGVADEDLRGRART